MRIVAHHGAERWVPEQSDLRKIVDFFGARLPDATVHLVPRAAREQVLGRLPAGAGPYAFRAVTRGSDSYVLVDDTETRASVAFLMSHELCHQLVKQDPHLHEALASARAPSASPWDDRFHEVDAEERFCDGIAGKILGTWYDRGWWRETLRARGEEQGSRSKDSRRGAVGQETYGGRREMGKISDRDLSDALEREARAYGRRWVDAGVFEEPGWNSRLYGWKLFWRLASAPDTILMLSYSSRDREYSVWGSDPATDWTVHTNSRPVSAATTPWAVEVRFNSIAEDLERVAQMIVDHAASKSAARERDVHESPPPDPVPPPRRASPAPGPSPREEAPIASASLDLPEPAQVSGGSNQGFAVVGVLGLGLLLAGLVSRRRK